LPTHETASSTGLQRLLDDLPLAALLLCDGRLTYANPAALELFPVLREQPVPDGALGDAALEASETGRAIEVEFTSAGRDLRLRASPTAPGEVSVVVSDLTETRRVEAICVARSSPTPRTS
jgi:PAS domain-containing protein